MGRKRNRRAITELVLFGVPVAVAVFWLLVDERFRPSRTADLPCRNRDRDASAVAIDGFTLCIGRPAVTLVIIPSQSFTAGRVNRAATFGDDSDFLESDRRVVLGDQRGFGRSRV